MGEIGGFVMAVFFIGLHLIWRLSKFLWKSYGCENNCISDSSKGKNVKVGF